MIDPIPENASVTARIDIASAVVALWYCSFFLLLLFFLILSIVGNFGSHWMIDYCIYQIGSSLLKLQVRIDFNKLLALQIAMFFT
jgi:hypothetical protein